MLRFVGGGLGVFLFWGRRSCARAGGWGGGGGGAVDVCTSTMTILSVNPLH